MQRYVLSKKNQIALVGGILIVMAFFGRFVLDNLIIFNF